MNTLGALTAVTLLSCVFSVALSLDGCTNKGHLLECRNVSLLELPAASEISDNFETLDFSFNHIANITFLNYENIASKLSMLLLNDNQISIIRNNSFRLLTKLNYLDLSSNLIAGQTLDEYMFNDLRMLKTLILERNPLRYLKKNTFNFMELPAIETLDMSHAEISIIEAGALDLPSLKYLDISWNFIESFEDEAFHMMVDLVKLDMSHNRIKILDSVPYLPEIRTWLLDNNAIEQVTIADKVMNYADSLQVLSLKSNNIMRFTQDSLPLELETLVLLDLSGNELHCDCRMKWLPLEEAGVNRTINMPCAYPGNMRDRNLIDIPRDELKCGYPLYQVLLGVGLIVVVVTCVTSLAFFIFRRRGKGLKIKKPKTKKQNDLGGNYTAVYTKEDEDVTVQTPDDRRLLDQAIEFNV